MAQIEPIELAKYRDPDGAVYGGLGAELRQVREASGRDLSEAAEALRLRIGHLEAIEGGRFSDLPGRVYAIGFIRAYAVYLGLDPQSVVARFRQETSGSATGIELNFPEPPPQSWRPNVGLFGLAILIVIAGYAAWYVLQTADDVPTELVAEVPERLMAPETPAQTPSVTVSEAPAAAGDAPAAAETLAAMEDVAMAPADEVAPDPMPRAEAPAATTAAQESPADGPGAAAEAPVGTLEGPDDAGAPDPAEDIIERTIAAAPPEAEVTPASEPFAGIGPNGPDSPQPGVSTAITGALAAAPDAPDLIEDPPPPPAAPSAGYEPRVYGQINGDARVVLRALSDTWVQVQGADNDLILTRILRPGDVFMVPNRDDLTLVTGNAGGLEVLVDGELVPPLGTEGAVRRDIPLSPEALTSGRAVGQR